MHLSFSPTDALQQEDFWRQRGWEDVPPFVKGTEEGSSSGLHEVCLGVHVADAVLNWRVGAGWPADSSRSRSPASCPDAVKTPSSPLAAAASPALQALGQSGRQCEWWSMELMRLQNDHEPMPSSRGAWGRQHPRRHVEFNCCVLCVQGTGKSMKFYYFDPLNPENVVEVVAKHRCVWRGELRKNPHAGDTPWGEAQGASTAAWVCLYDNCDVSLSCAALLQRWHQLLLHPATPRTTETALRSTTLARRTALPMQRRQTGPSR